MTETPEQPIPEDENQDAVAEADVIVDAEVAAEESAPADDTEQPVAAEADAAAAEEAVAEEPTPEDSGDEAEVEIAFVDADGQEVVADETAAPQEEAADPFTIQQQDEGGQAINPLAEAEEEAPAEEAVEAPSPINVVDEGAKPARQRGLGEIFFDGLDDGVSPEEAFAAVRSAQMERVSDMPADELALGLDAAQTAFSDAMETGSSPEEAFVLAGDAAARVMASRGFGRAA